MTEEYRNTAKIGVLCGRKSADTTRAAALLREAGWECIPNSTIEEGPRHIDDIASDMAVRVAAQMSRGQVARCFVVASTAEVLEVPSLTAEIIERCAGAEAVDIVSRAISLDNDLKAKSWLGKTWHYMLDARAEAALAGRCDWADCPEAVVGMMENGHGLE